VHPLARKADTDGRIAIDHAPCNGLIERCAKSGMEVANRLRGIRG
jgi:hypothetical protein